MRSLGSLRISVLTQESTSLERQREIVTQAIDSRGHELVALVDDPDVSASKVPPWDRPSLGPWLTEPDKLAQWDELVFWRMDRFVRSISDLAKMIDLCKKHNKGLRSATEPFDLSTPIGQAMAYLIAIFAQMESHAIAERVTGAHKFLRENGRWAGGKYPYGYVPVPRDGGGYVLIPDPEASRHLTEVVTKVLAGESLNSLVGPPDGPFRGSVTTLRRILSSPNLLGQVTHKGQVVHGEDGMPVQRADPLVDWDTFTRLQSALKSRTQDHSQYRTDANPLLGVAKCWECGSNYTRRVFRKKKNGKPYGKTFSYYCCVNRATNKCKAAQIPTEWVEAAVQDRFLTALGATQRRERTWVVPQGTPGLLEASISAYETLTSRLETATSPSVRGVLEKQMVALEKRIEELEGLPNQPSGWQWHDTGETWATAWHRSDWSARRQMLLKAGMVARVGKPNGIFSVEVLLTQPEQA